MIKNVSCGKVAVMRSKSFLVVAWLHVLAVATLAGFWPALRALRVRITEAIAYE